MGLPRSHYGNGTLVGPVKTTSDGEHRYVGRCMWCEEEIAPNTIACGRGVQPKERHRMVAKLKGGKVCFILIPYCIRAALYERTKSKC